MYVYPQLTHIPRMEEENHKIIFPATLKCDILVLWNLLFGLLPRQNAKKKSRRSSDVSAVFESVWVGILHLTNASESLVMDGWKIVGGAGGWYPRKVHLC